MSDPLHLPPKFGLNWTGPSRVEAMLKTHGAGRVTYDHVGATRDSTPEGWTAESLVTDLGEGLDVYQSAIVALKAWTQFDLSWVRPLDATVPIEQGQVFGFQSRQFGVWLPHFCRIVYTFDEEHSDGRSFGFAYGTLTHHMLRGEERFEVSWDKERDLVQFKIARFSQPANLLVRALGPLARAYQQRFLRDAMHRFSASVSS